MKVTPINARLCDAPAILWVSKHILRKWEKLGQIRIHRPTGNTAFIEIAEVQAFIRGEKEDV